MIFHGAIEQIIESRSAVFSLEFRGLERTRIPFLSKETTKIPETISGVEDSNRPRLSKNDESHADSTK